MPSPVTLTRQARITFALLLIASAILLAAVVLPVWKPLFLAAVLAAALSPLNEWLTVKLRRRPKLATTITTALVFVVLMIPFITIGAVIVGEAIDAYSFLRTTLEEGGVAGLIERLIAWLPDWIEQPINEMLAMMSVDDQAMAGGKAAAGVLGSVLSGASTLGFDLVLTLIALHALLLHGQKLVGWIVRVSPLPETGELLSESRRVSGLRSVRAS